MKPLMLKIPFALLTVAFLVSGCSTTRISSFKMDVSESPEVYGISRAQAPRSHVIRLHGSFKLDKKEDISVSGHYGAWDEDSLQQRKQYVADGIYRMGGLEGTGGFEWFKKFDHAVFGAGFGVNDGFFHHLSYGFNFEALEFGVFLGLFHQYTHINYSGSKCSGISSCDSEDWKDFSDSMDDVMTDLFFGLYIGVFIEKDFFLNYSLSTYDPSVDTGSSSVSTPMIVTNYLTLGYNINKYFSVTGGVICSIVDKNLHWSASVGAGFTPF